MKKLSYGPRKKTPAPKVKVSANVKVHTRYPGVHVGMKKTSHALLS